MMQFRVVEVVDGEFVLMKRDLVGDRGWEVVENMDRSQADDLWAQMGHVLRTDKDQHRNDKDVIGN